MICRRATYFTDLEMIEYYQKTCGWNSKSVKTKKYVKNYTRYTMLKTNSLCFTIGSIYGTVTRTSQSLINHSVNMHEHHDTVEIFNEKKKMIVKLS